MRHYFAMFRVEQTSPTFGVMNVNKLVVFSNWVTGHVIDLYSALYVL